MEFQVPVARSTVHRCFKRGSRAARNPNRSAYGLVNARFQRGRKVWNCKANCDPKHCCTDYSIHNFCATSTKGLVINMDDAAQFMLDSVSSHKQHGVMASCDKPIMVERTNYVKSINAHIQVTSHMIWYHNEVPGQPGTLKKVILPIGVVKPNFLFDKNPFQHTLDTVKIFTEFGGQFGEREILMWQHDRGLDCGPDKAVMRLMAGFLSFRLEIPTVLITARHAGGSYLNPVERQNGALKVAESHCLISSTLLGPTEYPGAGPWYKQFRGPQRLYANLKEAARVYKDRVDGAPFMGNRIKLIDGANELESVYTTEDGVEIDFLDPDVQTIVIKFATEQFSYFVQHPNATKCKGSANSPGADFFLPK